LAGGIAHDFNNLLQAVQGNLSILLEQTDELESKNTRSRLRRPLQKAFTATARASSLTRQLLAYSGRTRPSIRPTDLTEVVAETSELLELPATGKAKLVLELDRNLPPIPADRTQLQQVVMNLITNAVEAIDDPNTGRVRLRTSVESLASSDLDGDVLSSQLEPGRFVVVEVNDNGQGIPKDARSTMFDPFFTTKFTGRGLGLAAVQGIVRSHGGAILISSELSVGTTIRVALPLEAQPPASGSNSANPSSSGLSLRVLVADPSEIVRESSIMALESAGWFVSTASTPTELLDAMHRGELSTVVIASDLFDDPDTTWWLPLMEPSPRIRVFVTGEAESVPPVVRDRCSGILAKPYAPSDIISLVTSGPINN
ncbi:MAG: ATP-binding protein, partial [Planctomycetota bacterium]